MVEARSSLEQIRKLLDSSYVGDWCIASLPQRTYYGY